MDEFSKWFGYLVSGLGGALVATFGYKLKNRKLDFAKSEKMIDRLTLRVDSLEKKYDILQREHMDCQKKQSALEEELKYLRKQQDRGPNRSAPGTR